MARVVTSMLAAVAALAIGLGAAACGGAGGIESPEATAQPAGVTSGSRRATLVLDFIPNAVHAGIYRALAAGYYADSAIELEIIQPTSTADTLKLVDAGKADLGIADGIDVATQIDRGRDVKAVMALVQRPLGAVIALAGSGIASGRELEGTTVGVTGAPSDEAILRAVVTSGGGDTSKLTVVTIGFNGVQALESGSVDGFVGFWPADGVQVGVDGFEATYLAFDENGGPRYPGLVVFTTRQRIAADAAFLRAFVDATVRGYEDVLADPAGALADLLAAVPELDEELARAQLDAYLTLFLAGAPAYGAIDVDSIRALSDFLVANGLIGAPIEPGRFGTNALLPGAG
ncbi:MAG: ABC transporter substrate-binding protein [Thermoleophilia bacterium]|nr:ABC transporter substrate-binding protein [Thermoleophilia bacterium]